MSLIERTEEQIFIMISAKTWSELDALPSLRRLAHDLNVSHETVRRALRNLEIQDLIRPRRIARRIYYFKNESRLENRWRSRPRVRDKSHEFTLQLSLLSSEYDRDKARLWKRIIAEFEKGHPGMRLHGAQLRGVQELEVMRHLPAIVHVSRDDIIRLAKQNLLLDTSPWLAGMSSLVERCVPGVRQACSGKPCWGIPVTTGLMSVYANTSRIPKPDWNELRSNWNYEGLVDWAIAHRTSATQRLLELPLPYEFLLGEGIDLQDAAGIRDNPFPLLAALQRIKALHDRYPLYEPMTSLAYFDAEQRIERFRKQEGLLVVNHSFYAHDLLRELSFTWSLMPLPDGGSARVGNHSMCLGLSKDCLYPKEAMRFIAFVLDEWAQGELAKKRNNFAVRSEANQAHGERAPAGFSALAGELEHSRESGSGCRELDHVRSRMVNREVYALLQDRADLNQVYQNIVDECANLDQGFAHLKP